MFQNYLISFILFVNKKFFFKKLHPFNQSKNGVLNINYTDFEYNHTEKLLSMCEDFVKLSDFKNKKILDVWCWWWWKSIYIAKYYDSEVIWIDLSEDFVKQANNWVLEYAVKDKVSFYLRDALDNWFNSEEFDIIILSDVIEHIPNTEKLFEECYRVLKKGWFIFFDFAPYYHYFWHHIWDTIQIPWLHVFTTESFRVKLYKKSLESYNDSDKRLKLRLWLNDKQKESFVYLNGITRNDFENIIKEFLICHKDLSSNIKYYMLRNIDFFSKVPVFRELFVRHIVWVIKK